MDKVEFVIIESRGTVETLACPNCGEMFEVDAWSSKNLVFNAEWKGLVAKCPGCGAEQEPLS